MSQPIVFPWVFRKVSNLAAGTVRARLGVVPRFWLTYCDPSGRLLGMLILDCAILIQNRPRTAAMAAIPIHVLLNSDNGIKKQIKDCSVHLLRSIGSFTVLNYEDELREALRRHAQQS